MNPFKKNSSLIVKIKSTKHNDTLDLFFNLLNVDIVDRWIEIINKNNELKKDLYFNYVKKLNDEEIKKHFNDFNKNINYINDNYDKKLINQINFEKVKNDLNILNLLHEDFQDYNYRLDNLEHEEENNKKMLSEKHLMENFNKLNINIHNTESLINNDENFCLIRFLDNQNEDLKEKDYFLFSDILIWGTVYLGYNTIGKNFVDCFKDNDINLVKQKKVRPQRTFSSEIYINFNDHQSNKNPNDIKLEFYKWWIDNKLSQYYSDISVKDFTFGLIPIGFLHAYIINKKYYMINDKLDKKDWNQKIWRSFDTIVCYEIKKNNPFLIFQK